jgi:hypothetical protein
MDEKSVQQTGRSLDYTHNNGVTSESEHQSLEHPPSVWQLRNLTAHTFEVLDDFRR